MPTLTILGSGTSFGVPMVGCDCDVCRSNDPRDKRLRAAAWLKGDAGTSIIVDVGPDLRTQCLRAGIRRIDGVLLTHIHADHLNGIDDIRAFSKLQRMEIPFYASRWDLDTICSHYSYMIPQPDVPFNWDLPRLAMHDAYAESEKNGGYFTLGEFKITPVMLQHGRSKTTGYRVGTLAYMTDCNVISDASMDQLRDLDVLVIDALRWTPHRTHFSFDEALDVVHAVTPKRTYFIHMCHDVSHERDSKKLPPGVFLSYDGLEIEF